MSIQARVAHLKQHLEHLFPGSWVSGQEGKKTLLTGLPEIDTCLPRGLARQHITEWVGPQSSGKTTILRALISNWLTAGLHVAYIDAESKLVAADWAFVEAGMCGAMPASMAARTTQKSAHAPPGRFWVVRQSPTRQNERQNSHIWVTDQIIRSHAFDIVVLDLGEIPPPKILTSKTYARLQNSLSRAKTALIVLRADSHAVAGWGCHLRLTFKWGEALRYEAGLSGIAMIVPTIKCSIEQDGLTRVTEVELTANVSNRLFTHPPVPDRRTPKARA